MPRPNQDVGHLQVLREHFSREKVLPSYARLGELLGFKGKAGAFKLAQRLMAAGFLEQASGGRLIPTDQFFALPRLDDKLGAGVIESTTWSGSVEAHAIDRMLVDRPDQTVLVPVRGDSMIDAGVLDGDTAVVERTAQARRGDFVAALVDGQYTIKELRFERRKPILVPHNRLYDTIRPQEEFQILGVVRGIVRRYGRPHRATGAKGEDA